MSRLPEPGGDDGTWGDILNDFLAVAHLDDGRIRPSALPEPQVADGSITPVKLSQPYVPTSEKAASNGVATLDGTGKIPIGQLPSGAAGADATTSSKGVVQLSGDLGGTAAAPTVPGLTSKYVKPAGGIPETDLDSNVQTKLNTGGTVGDATATTKGLVQLAGDFGGTASSPTVPGLANKLNTSARGAANGVAALDSGGKVPVGQLPAGLEPDATTTSKGIVQLAGDLAGTAASPTVPGLAAKANDNAVLHLAGSETVTGAKVFTSSIEVPNPTNPLDTTNKQYVDALVGGSGAPDATTSAKGIVQLAGDLGGTAASPTVPALSGKAADTTVVHNTGAETVAGVKTFSSSPIVPTPTAPTQVANKAYVDSAVTSGAPDASTTNKGIVQLAGDLAGTAALPTVPGLSSKAADSAVVHNTGAETVAGVKTFSSSPVVPTPSAPTQAANKTYVDSAISSSSAPDATTTSKGIVQLAGDLAGTATSPTVPGLANKADKTTTISAGTGLSGGGDLSANRTLTVTYGTGAGTAAQGNDTRITGAEQTANKGVANGYASLDGSGKVPSGQLPAITVSKTHAFSSSSNLIVEAGTHRLYNDSSAAWTITGIRATVGIPPTGASAIIDVNVDGTTIFTTQANRPTIAASSYTSGKVTNMNVTNVSIGSYLTVDVDQVGSSITGSDLTVQVEVL